MTPCNSHHSLLSESFNICCNSVRYGEKLSSYSMSPRKLSIICVNSWISGDHISWLFKVLNKSQSMVYCLYINHFLQIDSSALHHFSNQTLKTQKLLLAVNVTVTLQMVLPIVVQMTCLVHTGPYVSWTFMKKPFHMVIH